MTTFGTGSFGTGTFGDPRILASFTDTSGTTDTIRPTKGLPADNTGASDAVSVRLTRCPATETAGAADTTSRTLKRASVDTAGATDAVTSGAVKRLPADGAGASDTVTSGGVKRLPADTAGATDVASCGVKRASTDTAGATDAVTVRLTRGLTDTSAGSDTTVRGAVKWLTDPAGATDAPTLTMQSAGGFSFSEQAGASDAVTRIGTFRLTFADNAGAGDGATLGKQLSLTDAVWADDGISRWRRASLADLVTAADTLTPVLTGGSSGTSQGYSDTAGASDYLTFRRDLRWTIVALAGGRDSIVKTGGGTVPPPRPGSAFGDAEAAVVAVFQEAAALLDDAHAATSLIGYSGGRWLRINRTGGMPTLWRNTDNPIMTIAAYADDKTTALDLAWAARAALHAARGQYVGCGLAIADVLDAEGPAWSPDPHNPNAARYEMKVSLVVKPMVTA